ncbi:MAG: hypothetical protein V4565_09900 [Bacteroidota bacterium]
MIITERLSLSTIRREFSQIFPNLKLELYTKPCLCDGPAEEGFENNLLVNGCRTIYAAGEITITNQTLVSHLEEDFRNFFGIGLVVFKKNRSLWIDAYDFKDLTLEELNRF